MSKAMEIAKYLEFTDCTGQTREAIAEIIESSEPWKELMAERERYRVVLQSIENQLYDIAGAQHLSRMRIEINMVLNNTVAARAALKAGV